MVAILAVLVAIIVILAAALAVVVIRSPGPSGPGAAGVLGILSSSPFVIQGKPLQFTLQNLRSGTRAVVSTGDGNQITTTGDTFSYTYTTPGTYFVWVQETAADGTVVDDTSGSLQKVIVTPNVSGSLASEVSVPTIYFNTTKNPQAPITTTNTPFYLYGNYTQIAQLHAASNTVTNTTAEISYTIWSNVTVERYVWDFGNGNGQTVLANSTLFYPVTNPVVTTYANRGLFAPTLTLFTVNMTTLSITNLRTRHTTTSTMNTAEYSFTIGVTIAVGTSQAPFGVYKYKGQVPSPGIITEIVNAAGGPFSFDPQIDYETVGYEVIVNTQMTLLIYNGNSTTSFLPYAADSIPSVANGGIKDNFTTYTFHIKPGLGFSNGDPITAYDVWYTTIRSMLFQGGAPGTADWIISKYVVAAPIFSAFVPIMTDPHNVTEFNAINKAVSYDNATNDVTFHLVTPTPPSLFFTAVADQLGMGIMDAAWLKSVGAGITFTPKGFFDYQNESIEGSYNTNTQLHPVASGPFMINTYVPSQTVVLTPNPHYPGLPMIPKQNNTVIIEWVASPAVAYQLFQSGEGDIVTLLPPPYFKTLNETLVPAKQATIHGPFPTITELFFPFNLQINLKALALISPGYSIPSDYFANPLVRKAFAFAFNYTNYINRILGNKIYGFNFGSSYCGVLVQGLPDHVPPSQIPSCPTYNLTLAKQFLQQSGLYNTAVNFPIAIPTGTTTDFTASTLWAHDLNTIDPNIHMTPIYLNFATIISDLVPGSNGLPLYSLGWIADYPYPSDYTDAMYLVNGTYPASDGWDPAYLARLAAAHPTQASLYNAQAQNYTRLNDNITKADATTDPTQAALLYKQVEEIAVGLYMYTFSYQSNNFWVVKPWISPYQGDWGFQQNPTIGAGGDSVFFWWVKG